MRGSIKDILIGKKRIVIDYSAMFLMADNDLLNDLFDTIVEKRISIVMSRLFYYSHNSYLNTARTQQPERVRLICNFLDKVKSEQLILQSEALTFEDLLTEVIADSSNILMLAHKSLLLERIRELDVRGDMSVCVVSKSEYIPYIDIRSCLINEAPYFINNLSRSSDYLDVEIHCNVGDKVYDSEGHSVLLKEKISTGAEGIVFYTADPSLVAKVYHKAVITPLRWRKLTRMTQANLRADGICWPIKLLYTFNKVPVGYLMPRAEGKTLGSVFDGPEAMMNNYPDWKRISVVQTAKSIMEKIIFLHLNGVIIGDIQLKNMMIKDPDNVYIIDMDSVQFEDLPCPVGTEDYTPPDLWDYSFSALLREPVHEDYSCGILVFSLLFCGQHPYAQRHGKETLREEMQTLSFPYSMDEEDNAMIPIGGYDKIWNALPRYLQKMFVAAFAGGQRYQPQQWLAALERYAQEIESGMVEDSEAYELFPHTDTSVVEKIMPRTNFKKSIREAIIHSPTDSTESIQSSISPSKVVRYKGSEDKVFSESKNKNIQMERFDSYSKNNSTNVDHSHNHNFHSASRNNQDYGSINNIKDILKNKRIILLLLIFLVLVILIVLASLLLN